MYKCHLLKSVNDDVSSASVSVSAIVCFISAVFLSAWRLCQIPSYGFPHPFRMTMLPFKYIMHLLLIKCVNVYNYINQLMLLSVATQRIVK